jgi:hypothetical protein
MLLKKHYDLDYYDDGCNDNYHEIQDEKETE